VPSATEQFGRRLPQLRKDRGWSQPDLAKEIGTSGTIVGRYEPAR
jgi:ribosome-binding protein aMBF1 (putative translation factor)